MRGAPWLPVEEAAFRDYRHGKPGPLSAANLSSPPTRARGLRGSHRHPFLREVVADRKEVLCPASAAHRKMHVSMPERDSFSRNRGDVRVEMSERQKGARTC